MDDSARVGGGGNQGHRGGHTGSGLGLAHLIEPCANLDTLTRLHGYAKQPIDVFVRTAAEMRAILDDPQGMGQSKLVIPAAARGTARNMNTVAKLVALSS